MGDCLVDLNLSFILLEAKSFVVLIGHKSILLKTDGFFAACHPPAWFIVSLHLQQSYALYWRPPMSAQVKPHEQCRPIKDCNESPYNISVNWLEIDFTGILTVKHIRQNVFQWVGTKLRKRSGKHRLLPTSFKDNR